MANRAESILAAVATVLTGLATTGANVERSRAWPVSALPALSVLQGANAVVDDDPELDVVGRRLDVAVISHVQAVGVLETTLNQIAAEVFAALRADETLGLAYVFDVVPEGDDAPELEAEQDQPTARQVLNWSVLYEHSETSTEA